MKIEWKRKEREGRKYWIAEADEKFIGAVRILNGAFMALVSDAEKNLKAISAHQTLPAAKAAVLLHAREKNAQSGD